MTWNRRADLIGQGIFRVSGKTICIFARAARVPKTGRLYFPYLPFAEWCLATGMEESLLYKGVQTGDKIERE